MRIEPMLCELADPSSLEELVKGDWSVERKYDGERIVCQWNKGRVDMWTRRDLDIAKKFPEIVSAMIVLEGRGHTVVDGELVVGKDLEDLAKRQTEEQLAISILSKKMPAKYIVFDVLIIDGAKVMDKSLAERRRLLEGLFDPSSKTTLLCPAYPPDAARERYESFIAEGYEGLVAKRLSSKYLPGKRSKDWLKFKRSETIDVDIIGARRSEAGLPFASLIMMRNGRYFGCVGSGFTHADRVSIFAMLKKNSVDSAPVEIPKDVVPIVLNRPLPAEVKVNAILADGSPRASVWVRFRFISS
jgi:DNA ligase-1